MVEAWLTAWQALPLFAAFFVAFCLHFTIYMAWACGVSISFWLFRDAWDIGLVLEERPYYPAQLKTEIVRGTLNCAVIALVTLACLSQTTSAVPSTGRLLLELVGLIVFYDPVFYLLHRLLHTPRLRALHAIHHRSVRPTPWSGLSVHPLEAIFIELPILLFTLLVPVSVLTLVLFQVVLHYFSSIGHGNFDPFGRLRGFAALNRLMRMHQLHHSHGNVNYTSFNPIWDRIFGTYRP